MRSYHFGSYWKIYLSIAGIAIVLISLVYTNYLADRLVQGELDKVELYAKTMKELIGDLDLDKDIRYQQSVLELVDDVPVILVGENGEITESRNFRENTDLESELASIKKNGYPPIEGHGYASLIYFKHTQLLTLLTYFPFIQLLLILAFMSIGFVSLSNARRAEQNRVWVGMAKETAHQLGTPISGIMAWIDYLKEMSQGDEEKTEIIGELSKDVHKLELIAERFSKIGSTPSLTLTNILPVLEEVKQYIERRASNRIFFDFPDPHGQPVNAMINKPLFSWVLENILRNALDAMEEGEGAITAEIYEDGGFAYIDIKDTGKGIPANKQKTIFEPGYTTKTRGWGLGLSLAKRIIADYHSGKIFVKQSVINEGTTLTIALPKQKS